MVEHLLSLQADGLTALDACSSQAELESWEITYLGRKGRLAELMKQMATVSSEDRPRVGAKANEVKQALDVAFQAKKRVVEQSAWLARLAKERADVTEPGITSPQGHLHVVSQAIQEIADIFERAGFARSKYPEVDGDYYAFEALNMPKEHPARDEWETFFVDQPIDETLGKIVLTPHTSNAQVREMEKGILPIRMINIGKTYRRQSDATHVPMFHQFEGLYIDKGVSLAHLRGILDYFAKSFFGPERVTRLRPFHFRFTEPSFEIDISCGVCIGTGVKDGQKCRACKRGWHELGGAGMVHPNVLRAGGLDPDVYSGFAFGWGVERTYAMKEGLELDDIRILYKNDIRFLQQF